MENEIALINPFPVGSIAYCTVEDSVLEVAIQSYNRDRGMCHVYCVEHGFGWVPGDTLFAERDAAVDRVKLRIFGKMAGALANLS